MTRFLLCYLYIKIILIANVVLNPQDALYGYAISCIEYLFMLVFFMYIYGQPDSLKKVYEVILKDNREGESLRRQLQYRLKEAVDVAVKYCRWNYKTAIPVYYHRTNGISLLLPLKLVAESRHPADIALVIERLENGNYQGQTIFTLAMAYQDARQICRPNSEWLTVKDVNREEEMQ